MLTFTISLKAGCYIFRGLIRCRGKLVKILLFAHKLEMLPSFVTCFFKKNFLFKTIVPYFLLLPWFPMNFISHNHILKRLLKIFWLPNLIDCSRTAPKLSQKYSIFRSSRKQKQTDQFAGGNCQFSTFIYLQTLKKNHKSLHHLMWE